MSFRILNTVVSDYPSGLSGLGPLIMHYSEWVTGKIFEEWRLIGEISFLQVFFVKESVLGGLFQDIREIRCTQTASH